MTDVSEYKVVSDNSLILFEALVNDLIKEGWELFKGMQVVAPIIPVVQNNILYKVDVELRYYQVMIRKTKTKVLME